MLASLSFLTLGSPKRTKGSIYSGGHHFELHFLDLPVERRKVRLAQRNRERSATFEFEVDEATFEWMESYFERPIGAELNEAVVIRS
jgi:hypothetical protein